MHDHRCMIIWYTRHQDVELKQISSIWESTCEPPPDPDTHPRGFMRLGIVFIQAALRQRVLVEAPISINLRPLEDRLLSAAIACCCDWKLDDHRHEQYKTCLFRVYRGLYSPVMWAYKNHYKYKDHYLTTDMLESKWGCFFVVQFVSLGDKQMTCPLWGAFDQCFWKLGVSLSSSSTNHSIKCHDGYG